MDTYHLADKLKDIPRFGGVVTYDNLPKSLDGKLWVVLLIRLDEIPTMGHYVSIDDRNIPKGYKGSYDTFYFDPLGKDVDVSRKIIASLNGLSGPNDSISELLDQYKYQRNKFDYQDERMETCGDWNILYAKVPDLNAPIWKKFRTIKKPFPDIGVGTLEHFNYI